MMSVQRARGLACSECKLSCSMCTVDEVSNLVKETETLLAKGLHFGVFLQGGSDMQGFYSCTYLAVFLPYTMGCGDTHLCIIPSEPGELAEPFDCIVFLFELLGDQVP